MGTIVIANLKGGTGKTNLAMHTAVGLRASGRSIHVLDGDKNSQNAYDWARLAQHRGEPLPFSVERWPYEDDVAERIQQLRRQVDDTILDTGGGGAQYVEEAAKEADLVLVPVAPEEAEIRRLGATLAILERAAQLSTREVGMLVVLTKVKRASTQRVAWRAQLENDGLAVADTEIRNLVPYSDAYGTHPRSIGDYADLLVEAELVPARSLEAAG